MENITPTWKKIEPANSFTNVSQMVPRNTKKFCPARAEGQRVHFRVYFLPAFSALDENSNFALDWSRDKSEGTKVISALALVGVGVRIKSLSHLVN